MLCFLALVVSSPALGAGVRYSRTQLLTEPSTPCAAASEGEAECEIVAPPAEGPETGEFEGGGESGGFDPQDLRSAYGLPEVGGSGSTIAVVDAYNDPRAEADLAVYRTRYGLSACTEANGCFKRVNQLGEAANYPANAAEGWGAEISLDLDMVSAACADCKILLVEANSAERASMGAAVERAVTLGATAVSNSWNWGFEQKIGSEETSYDNYFNHPGTPIIFSGGDYGYAVRYPATSQYTVSVGGTKLQHAANSRGWNETVWSNPEIAVEQKGRGTGSGCSSYEPKPSWQGDPSCNGRVQNDISADASPQSPVSTYDSYEASGWQNLGGTSAAAPFVAGIEGLSNSNAIAAGAEVFYASATAFNDVVEGSNGSCTPPAENEYWCTAAAGYDGPTGAGTPSGAFQLGQAPLATTRAATRVSPSEATLHGFVNPHGLETSYRFEYGETTSYGSSIPVPEATAGAGNSSVEATQNVAGLTPETPYHFRLVATNSKATTYGADKTLVLSGWSVINAANLAEVKRSALEGMSCASTSACVAVGEYENSEAAFSSLAERWNGSQWQILPTTKPANAQEADLHSVSCGSISVCEAVGGWTNPEGKLGALVEGWNGTKLEAQTPTKPTGAKSTLLQSVSCSSATFCSAVGQYETSEAAIVTLAESWNGTKWKTVTTPALLGSKEAGLHGVACSTSTACVAVGWYTLTTGTELPLTELWNGTKWVVQSTPTPGGAEQSYLEGASCAPSSTVCFASGWYVNAGGVTLPLSERWNGSSWALLTNPMPAGAVGAKLNSIGCSASSACTAVGTYETASHRVAPLAERWTGSEWQLQSPASAAEPAATELNAVACPSTGVCRASGDAKSEETPTALVEEANNGEWSLSGAANPGEPKRSNLESVACGGSSACVSVGEYESAEGAFSSLAELWNGTQWQVLPTSKPSNAQEDDLRGASCGSSTNCVAVGDLVTIEGKTEAVAEGWSGTNLEAQKPTKPTGAKFTLLRSVSCSATTFCAAVGQYETSESAVVTLAESWDGTKWKTVLTPALVEFKSAGLRGVACSSSTACVAVGSYTTTAGVELPLTELWNGKKWLVQTTPTPVGTETARINGVTCANSESCMATGWYESGGARRTLVERWTGAIWQMLATPNPAGSLKSSLNGVGCSAAFACTAVGSSETAGHSIVTLAESWNGSEWRMQVTPNGSAAASELNSAACPSPTFCLAAGLSSGGEGTPISLMEEFA
jgi:hypothetical protein